MAAATVTHLTDTAAVVTQIATQIAGVRTPHMQPQPTMMTQSELDAAERLSFVYANRTYGHEAMLYLPHLLAWRTFAGWSQFDLAVRADCAISTVRRLERQQSPCRLGMLYRLASAFGITSAILATRAPEDGDLVVGPIRTQCVERPRTDGQPGTELAFYLYRVGWTRAYSIGMDLATLAARTGIDAAMLDAIERMEEPATLDQASSIAQVLGSRLIEMVKYH